MYAVTTVAQAPPQGPPGGMAHGPAPKPTNLKVLDKNLTGEQVHEIMHKWAGDLGVECNTCHVPDPTKKMPNGRPAMNFADDSKPEKRAARMMFTMMQDVNKNTVAQLPKTEPGKDDDMVSCGTCHRGHLNPPEFVAPPEHHGPPPAGGQPPMPH